ncbi:hypothetical protein D3C72_1631170 [compost metagenome]
MRTFVHGLGACHLQAPQFRVDGRELDIELGNRVHDCRHHRVAVASVERGNHRRHTLREQRLAAGRYGLGGTRLFLVARNLKIRLPGRVGLAREVLCRGGARLGVGRVGGESGLIQQHAHQQLVGPRFGQIRRSGKLLLIDLARSIVAARHAQPTNAADNQQQQIRDNREEPQPGSDRSVAKHGGDSP